MDQKRIGEKIAELRKSQGLTQAQLAEKSGLGIASIVRYEKGSTFPRGDNLQRLAACFNVDSKIFFDENETQTATDKEQIKSKLFNTSIPFSSTYFEALSPESREKVHQYIRDLYFAEQFLHTNEEREENIPHHEQLQRIADAVEQIEAAAQENQNEKKA